VIHWWDEPYPEASLEENLAGALHLLAVLDGDALDELERAAPGTCDDCSTNAARYVYGRVIVCRRCAASRFHAEARVA
jgi:hypothetical protein